MKILIIALNISKPYLGPSAVAYNTLRGFLKIDEELKGNGVEITFLSINDERKVTELNRKTDIYQVILKIFAKITVDIQVHQTNEF